MFQKRHCSAGLNGDADIKPQRSGGTISDGPEPDKLSTTVGLTLQLRFACEVCTLEMGTTSIGLVGAPPQRPCDDVSGLDAPVGELDGDAADFLDRPAH